VIEHSDGAGTGGSGGGKAGVHPGRVRRGAGETLDESGERSAIVRAQ